MASRDSIIAWYPSTIAGSLPGYMLETDTRLSCAHLNEITKSVFGNGGQCMHYKYSDTLAYKPICWKRETDFIARAGNLTFPVLSKIGTVHDDSWHQKGAIIELGIPFDVEKTTTKDRLSTARLMVLLVTSLHQKGIIHGDIKPDNFMWAQDKKELRIINFGSARLCDESDRGNWKYQGLTPEYISPERTRNGNPPTVFDDVYALAVTTWAVFAGEWPHNGLFNTNEGGTPDLSKITDGELFCSVVNILDKGGFNLDHATTLARKDSLPTKRVLSLPLSLFGECPDVLDDTKPMTMRPRFCQHCFDAIMRNPEDAIYRRADYLELCHLRKADPDLRVDTDANVPWLDGRSEVSASPAELHAPVQQMSSQRKSRSPPHLNLKQNNYRHGSQSWNSPSADDQDYLTARPLNAKGVGAWVASLPAAALTNQGAAGQNLEQERSLSYWSFSTDEQDSPGTGSKTGSECSDSSQLKTSMPVTARFSPPSSVSQKPEEVEKCDHHLDGENIEIGEPVAMI